METAFPREAWAGLPVSPSILRPVVSIASTAIGEGVGQVGAPRNRAVAQGDVVGVLDGEAGGVVQDPCGWMAVDLARGGAIVEEAAFELGGAGKGDGDAVEGDVVNAARALPQTRTEFSAVPVTILAR
jgi:hypothetical protein